jgi:hypothetical protein
VFGTFICIGTINCSVNTVSRVDVARIGSTCILVITVDSSVNAFSRRNIARNGLAWLRRANNRSVDAVSIRARISCAQVVIVTNFVSVLASLYNIARSNRTFVSVIASDWGMLDSVFNCASISGTCILVITVDSSVLASLDSITSINSARIVVITVNRCVNTFFKIT